MAAAGKTRIAFLDDHQEQQAIDQSQQGFVVVISGELSGGELLAERFVGGVIEESVAEAEDGMFDGGGESFADAGSGIEGILVVAFDQAFGGGVAGAGQSGSVQDAVEDGEVGEETVGEDTFQVEFDEALFDESGGIAEESEGAAVGDESVELFIEVQEFLNEGMGGYAKGGVAGFPIKSGVVAEADDMQGCLTAVGDAVRDGVGLAVEFCAGFLEFEVVFEETEEGDDPEVAGFAGGGAVGAEVVEFALKDAPVVLGIGPCAGDFVLDSGTGFEAEVGGFLPREIFQSIEEVGGKDGTFDADTGIIHGVAPEAASSGSRT